MKSSTLNPLANSFVPSKKTETTNSIKEIAEKYVKELMEKKEAKGETSLTKFEMAELVGHLITLRFNAKSNSDILKINRYLSEKILCADIPQLTPSKFSTAKFSTFKKFDFTKFKQPSQTYLIVAFWGLHRHEQATKPVLSLTHRPALVTDKIWSLNFTDKALWNQTCVEKVCKCPPMFGYSIPPIGGDILNISYNCSERRIHLNHYLEGLEGNEYILTSTLTNICDEQPFIENIDDNVALKMDINTLENKFLSIVKEICDLLTKDSGESKKTTEDDFNTVDTADTSEDEEFEICFWDKDRDKFQPQALKDVKSLPDDGIHPLLEIENFVEDEEVSPEIQEMIRRSLSQRKDLNEESLAVLNCSEPELKVHCDPPCSIWCSSNNLNNDIEQAITVEAVASLEPETSTEDIPEVDLVSSEQLNAETKPKPEKFSFVDLKPVLDLAGPKTPRPFFKRSFSVNDCDPFYYDTKFGLNSNAANECGSMSSKEMLMFLRKDPVNFFKTFNRSNSWKDTDSGFVSHWSSRDDIFDKGDNNYQDPNSMWGLFSGEDSLWKPLPERTTSNEVEEKPLPHRRVHDLRRQKSVN